jgi:hypothetical protein
VAKTGSAVASDPTIQQFNDLTVLLARHQEGTLMFVGWRSPNAPHQVFRW